MPHHAVAQRSRSSTRSESLTPTWIAATLPVPLGPPVGKRSALVLREPVGVVAGSRPLERARCR